MKLTSNYIEIDVVFTLPNSSHVHRLAHFKFQQLDYTHIQPLFLSNYKRLLAMESRTHAATIHLNYTKFSATREPLQFMATFPLILQYKNSATREPFDGCHFHPLNFPYCIHFKKITRILHYAITTSLIFGH